MTSSRVSATGWKTTTRKESDAVGCSETIRKTTHDDTPNDLKEVANVLNPQLQPNERWESIHVHGRNA